MAKTPSLAEKLDQERPLDLVAYLSDQKTSGTNGGTFTSGAWQSRTLNVLEGDTSFISLDTEGATRTTGVDGDTRRFILQPGTYKIEGSSPAAFIDNHKIRLVSDPAGSPVDEIIGSSERSHDSGSTTFVTRSFLSGEITITVATTFELQHRCSITRNTDGFGTATIFGINEVYSLLKITKVT